MLFWKPVLSALADFEYHCFNPYFVGCYSGRNQTLSTHLYKLQFQSLFCWMLFWKYYRRWPRRLQNRVSILILLDVILEDNYLFCALFCLISFNPYFVGCYSGRQSIQMYLYDEQSFNPYFVGCYSGRLVEELQKKFPNSFQSLFCWMLFWKREALILDAWWHKFQSLFCWMLFWKIAIQEGQMKIVFVSILILLDVILEEWFLLWN